MYLPTLLSLIGALIVGIASLGALRHNKGD